jgi:hypothetical protein
MNSISRIASLEKENIELQEEILSLKRQLMLQRRRSTGGSRPASPEPEDNNHAFEELEVTVRKLKETVKSATDELRKYRDTAKHESHKITPIQAQKVVGPHSKDDFDLDDLLN